MSEYLKEQQNKYEQSEKRFCNETNKWFYNYVIVNAILSLILFVVVTVVLRNDR